MLPAPDFQERLFSIFSSRIKAFCNTLEKLILRFRAAVLSHSGINKVFLMEREWYFLSYSSLLKLTIITN